MTGTAILVSLPTNISYKDSYAIELVWTGTPTGIFAVQGSVDYNPGLPQSAGTANAGNWVNIPVVDVNNATPTAAGAAGVSLINMNQLAFPWIRVKYTNSAGSGSLTATIFGKSLG